MKDDEKDARTLFVRNVSFDVDESKLEEVFSDVGPVRQCFLVRNKGQQRHRGFGFVQYSIPEDAERAEQQLNGHDLHGRKLKVEPAVKRASLEERKKRKQDTAAAEDDEAGDGAGAAATAGPAAKKARPAAAATPAEAAAAAAKHTAVRTVALGGTTPTTLAAALQLARQAGGLQEVQDPPPPGAVERAHLAADGCSGHVVFLVYATVKDATHAVTQLHGQAVTASSAAGGPGKKGKQKKAAAAAQGGAEGEGSVLWARQVAGEGAHLKQYRVIIRNLPFQATEEEVRQLLAPAGFVWSLQLPLSGEGKPRGFAFASFTSYPDASKAVALCNGKTIHKRPVAVDWAVGKQQYQQLQQQQEGKGAAKEGAGSDEEAVGGEGSSSDGEEGEEEDDDTEEEMGMGSSDEDEEAEDSSGSEEEEDSDAEEEEEEEEEEGSDGAEAAMLHKVLGQVLEEDKEEAQQKPAAKAAKKQVEQTEQQPAKGKGKGKGKEVDAAAEAAADAVPHKKGSKKDNPEQEQQRQQVDSAEVVSSTVFVRGLSLDVTQPELQARFGTFGDVKSARLVVDKSTNQPKGTAFIEYHSPKGAAAAVAACGAGRGGRGPGVTLKGRTLEVDLALSKQGARQLAADQMGLPEDKRNLYLIKEGHIEEGSAAWNSMSSHDKAKRKRAAEERNTKLRSPNFFISTTRLSLRNIPRTWDEAQLKAACLAAVKARATKEQPVIKQVRILKESGDAPGVRAGRSKGIGFVEFTEHSHAMAALRQLNNNPTAFGSAAKRPIIEFAMEDVQVLRKIEGWRAQRQQREQQQQEEEGGSGGGGKQQPGEQQGKAQKQQKEGGKQKQKKEKQKGKQQQQQPAGEEGGGGPGAAAKPFRPPPGLRRPPPGVKEAKRDKYARWKALRELKRDQRQQGGAPSPQQNGVAGGKPAVPSNKQQPQQQHRQQGPPGKGPAGARGGRAQDAERQQQQHQRKRRADDMLDALASSGEKGRGKDQQQHGGKRRRPGQQEEAKLDKLVEQYKSKLFGSEGGGNAGGAAGGSGGGGASLKRWFD